MDADRTSGGSPAVGEEVMRRREPEDARGLTYYVAERQNTMIDMRLANLVNSTIQPDSAQRALITLSAKIDSA